MAKKASRAKAKDSKSKAKPRGGVAQDVLNTPGVKEALLALLMGWLTRTPKPTEPVVKPTPAPPPSPTVPPDDFPDDIIPAPPSKGRKVTSVRCKLSRAQYNRQRFPEQYTRENPMGLYPSSELRAIEGEQSALNQASKFWPDLTAYDQHGKEFLRDAVLAYGLAYKTEHHCGGAFIRGKGATAEGGPKPGYEMNDTDEIGNGISAWESSLGFLHQMKAWGEGTFEVWGVVDGVESNRFKIRVS
jgi:hypothetical protein